MQSHPYFREEITPSPYWLVEPKSSAARARLDELLEERPGSSTLGLLREGGDAGVHALGAVLSAEEMACEELTLAGVPVVRLLRIDAVYPLRLDPSTLTQLPSLMRALPGYVADDASFFRPASPRERESDERGLDYSVEPVGLYVFGLLPRQSWTMWRREFLQRISSWPLRDG